MRTKRPFIRDVKLVKLYIASNFNCFNDCIFERFLLFQLLGSI